MHVLQGRNKLFEEKSCIVFREAIWNSNIVKKLSVICIIKFKETRPWLIVFCTSKSYNVLMRWNFNNRVKLIPKVLDEFWLNKLLYHPFFVLFFPVLDYPILWIKWFVLKVDIHLFLFWGKHFFVNFGIYIWNDNNFEFDKELEFIKIIIFKFFKIDWQTFKKIL